MKLIIESPQSVGAQCENKDVYIQGVFATIGQKNKNGRVYSYNIWEQAVQNYQVNITTPTANSLMEFEHPNANFVNPLNAVAKIEALYIKDDKVIGKAKLLNNEKANILKDILMNGIPVGVSSRGVGDLDSLGNVTNYELITFDCVSDPSDYNAWNKMLGSDFNNGVYMKESFHYTPNGLISVNNVTNKEAVKYPIGDIMRLINNLKNK